MADLGGSLKKIWMKSMEAIGNTASNIASNTRFKVDEMNLLNRRREILSDFGAKSYALWQKGETFPAELQQLLCELGELDDKLNDLRAEKFSGVTSPAEEAEAALQTEPEEPEEPAKLEEGAEPEEPEEPEAPEEPEEPEEPEAPEELEAPEEPDAPEAPTEPEAIPAIPVIEISAVDTAEKRAEAGEGAAETKKKEAISEAPHIEAIQVLFDETPSVQSMADKVNKSLDSMGDQLKKFSDHLDSEISKMSEQLKQDS